MAQDPRLLDESLHLTAAFQLAGYPHVIGTLWAINDAVAAEIATALYSRLEASPAVALHQAVRKVRDRLPHTPSLWAADLHSGA